MPTRRHFLNSASAMAGTVIAGLTSETGLLAQAREKAKPLNLKVTDLKTFIVNRGGENSPNYVFVKIYTNEGLTGLGRLSHKQRGDRRDRHRRTQALSGRT
jgi:hypothetical protein